ncbi:MAG: hypothetical protein ACXWKC_11585 [Xanthobacteraceae bacterium]
MRLDIPLAILFLGAGLGFFALIPAQEEAIGTSQATEFSSRARTSVSRPGLTPKTSELQKAIEGRLRWLSLIE